MDDYAGGISSYYELSENRLVIAQEKLDRLVAQVKYLVAADFHELMKAHEVIDRLAVARD